MSTSSIVAWLRAQGAQRLVTDSRYVQAGDAFIAWPGSTVDGRQFIPAALANGAVAALMESQDAPKALQKGADAQNIQAISGLKAASGVIASEFYGEPSQNLKLIAITGTNGKTSSTWWLAQALSHLPTPYTKRSALVGTLGIGEIGGLEYTGLTTPDPVLLQGKLRTLLDRGCQAIVIEASSIGIAEGRLGGTHIHTAALTNFTQDHLDYHGTMEAYWQAKAALFDWPHLKAAVINLDDTQGLTLLDRVKDKPLTLWTYAASNRPARVTARHIAMLEDGLAFDVVEGDEVYRLQTKLVGRYNVSNLLGVIACMRSLNVPLALCVKACESITPVSGRLEIVSNDKEPLTLVDYAHTPDALEKVLITLREVSDKRGGELWCVFGCGGERDNSKRPLMGALARRYADKIVVTSDNPRHEDPKSIIAQILLGMEEDISVQVQVDRALAISETIAQLDSKDVLVIAGKGHEDYQEIAGIKTSFSDQAHAKAALAKRGAA